MFISIGNIMDNFDRPFIHGRSEMRHLTLVSASLFTTTFAIYLCDISQLVGLSTNCSLSLIFHWCLQYVESAARLSNITSLIAQSIQFF